MMDLWINSECEKCILKDEPCPVFVLATHLCVLDETKRLFFKKDKCHMKNVIDKWKSKVKIIVPEKPVESLKLF